MILIKLKGMIFPMIRTPQKIKMIKIKEISPNPYQIRRNFNSEAIRQLADSIKEVGMISPVILRVISEGYELICGQRRIRAAALLGMETVPAVIIRAGDRQCALLSMIENLQRENISLFEEAEGYYNLMSYHRVKKEDMVKELSLESGRINDKMRLLSLSAPIRYKIEENKIPEKAARELLRLHDEEKQAEIIEKVMKEELNLNDISSEVKNILQEMILNESKAKRGRKKNFNMPLCINTVKKTAELLKKSGAKVETEQTETENYVEFNIKIHKKQVF